MSVAVPQADEYERSQGKTLDRFFQSTEGYFTHPEGIMIPPHDLVTLTCVPSLMTVSYIPNHYYSLTLTTFLQSFRHYTLSNTLPRISNFFCLQWHSGQQY